MFFWYLDYLLTLNCFIWGPEACVKCLGQATGLMHISAHRDCGRTHKTCGAPSQTEFQQGGREVNMSPTPNQEAICNCQERGQSVLSRGMLLVMSTIPQIRPSPSGLTCQKILSYGWTSCPSSSSVLGFVFGLISHSSWSCFHNHCVFLCTTALLCPGNTISVGHLLFLVLRTFLPVPLWWSLSLRKKECDIDIPVRSGHSVASSLYVDQLRVSANCVYC